MPTYTAIALDSLLETGSRNPKPKPSLPPMRLHLHPVSASEKKNIPTRPPHAPSPVLYATPDVTPLPDSPSSFPPSPYIINHKRRGPRLLKSFSQNSVVSGETQSCDLGPKIEATNGVAGGGESSGGQLREAGNGTCGNLGNGVVQTEEAGKVVALEVDRDEELDNFLDIQDSISTTSNTEVEESTGEDRSWKPGTPVSEYYDAFEEILSDGTTRSSYRNFEDELCEIRLNLLTEMEKRKQAEEALVRLQNRWHSLIQQLALVGLTLPATKAITNETGEPSNLDPAEELCRQVAVARFVAGSIAKGSTRAEVEMEMEPQIETKNFEIARLSDRLQYYEAAKREMSQRNQEAVEMARQHRQQRKRRRRWIWSSVGLAVTLGAAALAWSYIPSSKPTVHHDSETSAGPGDQS